MLEVTGDVSEVNWRDLANCRGADADLFFSGKGETEKTKKAKSICAACLVQVQCLDFAVETVQRWGIWGGMTERQRRKVRRKRALVTTATTATGARLK